MKTYKTIKTVTDVKKGDLLVEFYFNSNEVWQSYRVYEVNDFQMTLECKSGALISVSNETLSKKNEYFQIAK